MERELYSQKQLKIFGILCMILFTVFTYKIIFVSRIFLLIFLLMEFYLLNMIIFNPNNFRFLLTKWIQIGNLIGNINSLILLTLFYFLIMTPISFLKHFIKIFKKRNACLSYYKKPIKESLFTEEF